MAYRSFTFEKIETEFGILPRSPQIPIWGGIGIASLTQTRIESVRDAMPLTPRFGNRGEQRLKKCTQ